MRISNVRLSNFKCFEETAGVALSPMTVIFGKNNSGKSSLIQSLLLLKQSTIGNDLVPRLNLRGPSYSAGSYSDIVHQHKLKNHIKIAVDLFDSELAGTIELEFAADEPQPPRLTRFLARPAGIKPLEIKRGVGAGGPYELYINDVKCGREADGSFSFGRGGFLPFIGVSFSSGRKTDPEQDRVRQSTRRLIRSLEAALEGIRAVGAFRQHPSRRYEYEGGASTATANQSSRVVDALFEDSTSRKNSGELLRGVNRWLKSVGRVKLLPVRRISKVARIFELRLRDTDSARWANFADVGFGIGQALPVLVEGLQTPEGGIFIVQEPEIHLHPDAQLAMADFLVSLVKGGRQVIVETHSEAILLRMRRAALPTKKPSRPSKIALEDVGVLYVDKNKIGRSEIKSLALDEMAQFEMWPHGFLEDVTEERIELLTQTAENAGAA